MKSRRRTEPSPARLRTTPVFEVYQIKAAMSALGQKQTCAVHQSMSALPPIATAKADSRARSCPLYPRKETSPSVIGISAKYTSRQRAKFVRRQTKWQHATLQPSFDTTHRRTHSDLGPALAEVRSARQAP